MKISEIVRKNILKLKPYTAARHSFTSGILLDANENSFGSVINDDWKVELNRYPDPNHTSIRQSLSSYLKVPSENLFVGVGSDEIIDLLIRIFCEPNQDNAVTLEPTYGMYKVACDVNSVATIPVQLDEDFQPNIVKTLEAVNQSTKIVFVCSPNNPTGNVINKQSIISLADKFNGIIIIDEAYAEFSDGNSFIPEINNFNNIVVTRTFSKAWGLAGARCGYCVADAEIIELLYKIKLPYNLNKLTERVVLEALKRSELKDKVVIEIKNEREYLGDELKKINYIKRVYPSEANYILFECDNASSVYKKLAECGIIIRDRSNQVKNALRVSVGTRDQNQKFINELRRILS
ncbi:MAG: histidinol-phosphate transaminase [Bacteroidota bacterium]